MLAGGVLSTCALLFASAQATCFPSPVQKHLQMITKNKQNIALVYYARFRSILKILKRKCERFSIVCQHCYMFWLEFAESQRALIEQCINKLFVCIFFFSVTDGKQTPEISWVDIFEAHTRFPARTRTGGCLKFPLVDCFISCGCDWLFVYGQM